MSDYQSKAQVSIPAASTNTNETATLAVAFLFVKAVWMRTRVTRFDSEMHGCMRAAKAKDGRERPAASTNTNKKATE